MDRIVLRCFFISLAVILTMLPLRAGAVTGPDPSTPRQTAEEERAVLITIHPGTTLFERYGHTLLCLLPAESTGVGKGDSHHEPGSGVIWNSSCYDFGVFSEGSVEEIVKGSLQGRRMFRGQELLYGQAVEQYRLLDRTIEQQQLPFSAEKVGQLRATLEDILVRDEGYAYHPFYNNCSTQVRDVLDSLSGGELKASARESAQKPALRSTFRGLAEEGFSGKALTLLGVELLVGSSASKEISSWQYGAFPIGLRDLVKEAWGVEPTLIYQQTWKPLPTSVHAGRALLILMGALLAGWIYWSSRSGQNGPRPLPLVAAGSLIALLGLLALFARIYSHYPEFSSNIAPLILFPGDAALVFLSPRVRKRYVVVRLVLVGLVFVLSLISVIGQPVLSLVLFVALPLVASLSWGKGAEGRDGDPRPASA